MLKQVYSIIFIICTIIIFFVNVEGYANSLNTPPSFEEKFVEVGYKSAEDAVKEFENHFKCDVKLPEIMPSISFTHQFGRFFEDKNYNINDSLKIMFVNKDLSENIYKIEIRPLKNKLNFKDKLDFNGKEYKLQDGTKAIYFEDTLFNFFVFEKNNLQYLLGIYKEVSNAQTPDILVRIANSVK